MKRRRLGVTLLKIIISGIIAMFIITNTVLWVSNKTTTETIIKEYEVIKVPEKPEEKDFILNIPLSCEIQEELYEACSEFGVDYYVMIALIDRETDFKNVLGDGGDSYGYCQIQPKWWYGLMTEIGATDLNTPKDNFRTACAIISRLTEKHQSIEGALVAYNQGYYKGDSTSYSKEIIANADRYRA